MYRYTVNMYSFEVRPPRCVEPKLINGKSTVKTQKYSRVLTVILPFIKYVQHNAVRDVQIYSK
jgi:hypothetical protein